MHQHFPLLFANWSVSIWKTDKIARKISSQLFVQLPQNKLSCLAVQLPGSICPWEAQARRTYMADTHIRKGNQPPNHRSLQPTLYHLMQNQCRENVRFGFSFLQEDYTHYWKGIVGGILTDRAIYGPTGLFETCSPRKFSHKDFPIQQRTDRIIQLQPHSKTVWFRW